MTVGDTPYTVNDCTPWLIDYGYVFVHGPDDQVIAYTGPHHPTVAEEIYTDLMSKNPRVLFQINGHTWTKLEASGIVRIERIDTEYVTINGGSHDH